MTIENGAFHTAHKAVTGALTSKHKSMPHFQRRLREAFSNKELSELAYMIVSELDSCEKLRISCTKR